MFLSESEVLARWPMLSAKELRAARRNKLLTFYAFTGGPHYKPEDVEAFIDVKYRRSAEPPAPRPPGPPPLPPLSSLKNAPQKAGVPARSLAEIKLQEKQAKQRAKALAESMKIEPTNTGKPSLREMAKRAGY